MEMQSNSFASNIIRVFLPFHFIFFLCDLRGEKGF